MESRYWPLLLASLLLLAPVPRAAGGDTAYLITTIAGSNDAGDGNLAVDASLGSAEALAIDRSGNIYIADPEDRRVRVVQAIDGTIATVAGTGHPGVPSDGSPAVESPVSRPYGVAKGANGVVYIADHGNSRILCVMPGGVLRTLAGDGSQHPPGSALSGSFLGPRNLALDREGSLYVSDFADHRIYRISPAGFVELIAGTGNPGYNGDGPAAAASFNAPAGLALDSIGRLYVADSGNNRIRRIDSGTVSTYLEGEVDGVPLSMPTGVALDSRGVLYVADSGNGRILSVEPSGSAVVVWKGYVRDIAIDRDDQIYVAGDKRVWRLPVGQPPELVAGTGDHGNFEEGALASSAYLRGPIDTAMASAGNLLIVEEEGRRVRRIDAAGLIRTAAGTGEPGSAGDGGLATEAQLIDPVAVATGPAGQVWIADHLGHRIRRIDSAGRIDTVAGNGSPGFDSAGNGLSKILLNRPRGMAADSWGNLYFADSFNHRVRRIASNGVMTTVAGSGVRGYSGDCHLAGQAQLNTPVDVAVDGTGNVYIADRGNHAIRMVGTDGFILTVAGDGYPGFIGDGGLAADARLDAPSGLTVDSEGNLFVTDTNNHRVRRIDAEGIIETIAGAGPGHVPVSCRHHRGCFRRDLRGRHRQQPDPAAHADCGSSSHH